MGPGPSGPGTEALLVVVRAHDPRLRPGVPAEIPGSTDAGRRGWALWMALGLVLVSFGPFLVGGFEHLSFFHIFGNNHPN